MYLVVTLFVLAIIFFFAAYTIPQAQGFSGCLGFIVIAFVVLFFMGSCVRLLA